MTEDKAGLTIYLNSETKDKLNALSKLNHISMSNYVINLINEKYDDIEKNNSNKTELLKRLNKFNTDNLDVIIDRELIYS